MSDCEAHDEVDVDHQGGGVDCRDEDFSREDDAANQRVDEAGQQFHEVLLGLSGSVLFSFEVVYLAVVVQADLKN